MRIVNAMFGCRLGGLEQVFLDYSEALVHAGHEVHALIHPRAAIRPAVAAQGVPVHAVSNFNAWDPLATLRLKRCLGTIGPDVTIAHGNRAVSLLGKAGAVPLVGVAPNYQLKCRGLAAVMCSTADLRRHYREADIPQARLVAMPNVVRAPAACPERVWHDPPVIGAMGRFVAKKGFEVLIEALRRLAGSGTAFRATLAGDGDERPMLSVLTAQAGLARRLDFPGWVNDKPGFFGAIDLFCLPSHHEPFGVVLLEAMAQGLPVISTASEGPSEILVDGQNGLLVPKGDPAALAAAIGRVLGDGGLAARLGRAGYETVRAHFDLPLLATRLDRALRAVAGGASPTSPRRPCDIEGPGAPASSLAPGFRWRGNDDPM
jgi:glycosyltransferase involved in cell wall biosynthesis